MNRLQPGFTLIEILVVISIIGLLVALLIPAVQAAREAARRLHCQSNLRQLAIAANNFEGTNKHLPGPTMNAHPSTDQYGRDSGLFVNMLPFMEMDSLFSTFNRSVPCNSMLNQHAIKLAPSLLQCPSASRSEVLSGLSDRFSGPTVDGLVGQACDYSGNDGAYVNDTAYFGTIRLRVGDVVRERRLAEITDGTSNTFLFWESVGDFVWLSRKNRKTISEAAPSSFAYLTDEKIENALQSNTQASTKSYLFSWSGFRIGTIVPAGGRAINVSNLYGEPFAAHPGLVNFALSDGSVRSINESIEVEVAVALSTAQNGEVVSNQ